MKYQELLALDLSAPDADIRFVEAMDAYMDRDYFATLERYGISGRNENEPPVETLEETPLLALLTWMTRADRFCEGALDDMIAEGYLKRCIDRLRVLAGAEAE